MSNKDQPTEAMSDAVELNDLVRRHQPHSQSDEQSATGDSARGPDHTELQDNAQYAYEHWDLSEKPRVGGRLAGFPGLGSLLAFGRELYGSFWLKANRRSPFAQQLALNRAMARAIRSLVWYIDDRDQIWIRLDRDVQVVRSGVGMLDSDVLRLEQQVAELQARIEILEREAQHTRNSL